MYCRMSLPAFAYLHSRETNYVVTELLGSTKRTKDFGEKKSKQTTKSCVIASGARTESCSSGQVKADSSDTAGKII